MHLAFVSVDLGDRRTIAACITTAFRARSPTPVYSVGSRYSICEIVLSVPVVQRCLRYSTAQIGWRPIDGTRTAMYSSVFIRDRASERSIDRSHSRFIPGRSLATRHSCCRRRHGDRHSASAEIFVYDQQLHWSFKTRTYCGMQ